MATGYPTVLTGGLQITVSWNAQVTTNLAGLGQPTANQNSLGKNNSWTFGSGAGQCNEIYYSLQSITNGAPVTLDLTNLTEVLGQAATTFLKIKSWYFWLLAATDTLPDGTVGNACSSVTIGNAGANPFVFHLGGTTPTYTINNGGQWGDSDPGAAGITVSGTVKNVLLTNNDAGNVAKLVVIFRGTA